jgi:L-2-hydroxycarboxylate dehydrogenase (NAD+)
MPENMPGEGIGHFFGAMRIDAFRPAKDFKQHMDNWIQRFSNAKTVEGKDKVIIPGEPEMAMQAERLKKGIPLQETVADELKKLAEKFGVSIE